MLKKSQIFYFLTSFLITFVVGIFVWLVIVSPVGPKIFTASLSSGDNQEKIILTVQDEQNKPENELENDPLTNFEIQEDNKPVILTEEQRQETLDDIQEKLDIISRQVKELIAEKGEVLDEKKVEKKTEEEIKDDSEDDSSEEQEETQETEKTVSCVGQININTASVEDLDKITEVGPATAQKIILARPFYSLNDLLKVSGIGEATLQKITQQGCAYVEVGLVGGGGGGSTPVVYSKILISEAQLSPIDQRFVELYNPNSDDINLTGWYLHRKVSSDYSSFITKTDFSEKTIKAKDYFLISRFDVSADMLITDLTLTTSNSLMLKNPVGEVSDEISWGEVAENLSWCAEFPICTPTPKAQNAAYVVPTLPTLESISITTPATKLVYNVGEVLDITGLVVTGTYSDGSTKEEAIIVSDISGFDSSVFATGQVLTITIDEKTTTYTVDIIAPVVPKNILINEIQVEGATTKDDWMELYNPNDFDVDISGWSMQRSSKTGIMYKKNFDIGNKIISNGYFLIVRNDASQELLDMADMTASVLQLSSDGTVYLVKNQEEILDKSDADITDKVGWGEAFDYENSPALIPDKNKSITRTAGADTDNNSVDFIIIDTPTPKGQ